jgi:hypothetical protein
VVPALLAAVARPATDAAFPDDFVSRRDSQYGGANGHNLTREFVPRHDWVMALSGLHVSEPAVEDLEVCTANPDGSRGDQHLVRSRIGIGSVDNLESFVAVKLDSPHASPLFVKNY